ncbi:hypothetical protein [Nitrosomonas communis]|uniref:hypothetical protein n=1 Tax=Nitrosomonas communis TaxID=44574 RepID=UPI003D2A3BAD
MREGDLVEVIFKRLRDFLDPELALQLEESIRHEFGGSDHYIQKHTSKRRAKDRAAKELKEGVPPMEVARRNGISRAEIYRLFNKKEK